MGDARMECRGRKYGFQLDARRSNLLDLRCSDNILIFAPSHVGAGDLLDALVKQLDRVGLLLNPEKTIVVTNEAQAPQTITTTAGVILRILHRDAGQKRFGSMLTSRRSKLQDVDLRHHFLSPPAGMASLPYEPLDTARQKCFHCKAFTLV